VETKTSYRKITFIALLLIAYVFLRSIGLGFSDLWGMVQGEIDEKRAEIKEYRADEYTSTLSRQLREESARLSATQANPGAGIDAELRTELRSERQRLMEENARNAEKIGRQVLQGDTEVLKRRARENAQNAAGNY
jgi:hypothetical protein